MGIYHKPIRPSSRRDTFARSAVFSSFRSRDARALDYDGFEDSRPGDQPVRLGHVVDHLVDDLGQRALRHWLKEAARTDGEEREAALQIAKDIAAMIDPPWSEVMSGGAAA